MISKIFYTSVVIFIVFGLFLTNLFYGEYKDYIYQFVIKFVYSKLFFWFWAITIYLIVVFVMISIISLQYWNFLYENFPEQFIS